jgi:hypothetical protein
MVKGKEKVKLGKRKVGEKVRKAKWERKKGRENDKCEKERSKGIGEGMEIKMERGWEEEGKGDQQVGG